MATDEILTALTDYLDAGTRSALRRLHGTILQEPSFTRATPWFDHATRLLRQDRWDEAIRVIERFLPGAFMSPDAHLMLSYAYQRIHLDELSRLEAFYAATSIDAIGVSGSGTRTSPWLVLHAADEYSFMRERGIRSEGYRTLQSDNAGFLDAHQCADGVERWFELVGQSDAL